jgi:hypothetical protein
MLAKYLAFHRVTGSNRSNVARFHKRNIFWAATFNQGEEFSGL